jgi:hypothetical protein
VKLKNANVGLSPGPECADLYSIIEDLRGLTRYAFNRLINAHAQRHKL